MLVTVKLVLSAVICLLLVGGASVAATNLAKNSVTTREIKDHTVQKVDVARGLYRTLKGSGGAFSGAVSLLQDGTYYAPVTATILGGGVGQSIHANTLSPNRALTARGLAVKIDPHLSNGSLIVTLMVNGQPTTLACEITGFDSSCNSGGAVAKIPPASTISLKFEAFSLGTSGETFVHFGFGV